MASDDLLLIGRVARAHGNRGQVIVNLETDFPEARFQVGQVVLVGSAEHPTARRIESVRFHQGRPIVALEGIASMNDADALAGADIWLRAADVAPLPAGTFYRHDLVGCEVRDVRDAIVGRVAAVEGPLERSCLVVDGARGEILIPLVDEICVRVDPPAGVIVVDPPEGLLDANDTKAPRG
ncbi:MAG TPA: ribosome maturation factor RimM [Vicinamibacterales bacterium]|nr:ribosome maturation factor RimM [Vicinamibacterales bacterium]